MRSLTWTQISDVTISAGMLTPPFDTCADLSLTGRAVAMVPPVPMVYEAAPVIASTSRATVKSGCLRRSSSPKVG